jgi:RNA polymerase sigma factor (sigma-70 family)
MRWAAWTINLQLLDWAKKYQQYVPQPNGSSLPIDPSASTAGPATLAQWTEFHKAIEELPDNHRQYWQLIYYGGLTVRDAAEVLGVSHGTAKKGWLDARLALCRKLHLGSNSQALPLRHKAGR